MKKYIVKSRIVPIMVSLILIIIAATAAIAALGAAMFLVVFRTLRALERLAHTLNDIANGKGDLTARLSESGTKEIADVSRYFNQTIGKINDLVIMIKEQAVTLSGIGGNLGSKRN